MAHIERSELFLQAARQLGLNGDHLERVLQPIEWALERDPEFFPLVPGTVLRLATTRPFPPAIPAYRLVYSVEGDACVLRSIAHVAGSE